MDRWSFSGVSCAWPGLVISLTRSEPALRAYRDYPQDPILFPLLNGGGRGQMLRSGDAEGDATNTKMHRKVLAAGTYGGNGKFADVAVLMHRPLIRTLHSRVKVAVADMLIHRDRMALCLPGLCGLLRKPANEEQTKGSIT